MLVYTNSWEVGNSVTTTKHYLRERAEIEKDQLEDWGYKVTREVVDTSINPLTGYEYSSFKTELKQ
jgi:hypothetical protein